MEEGRSARSICGYPLAMSARISNDRRRDAWSKIIAVAMISSGRSRSTNVSSPRADRLRRADDRVGERVLGHGPLGGRPAPLHGVDGGRQRARLAAAQRDEGLLQRSEEAARLGVRLRREHVEAEHHAGPRERRGGPKAFAIERNRRPQQVGREVGGEREGQAQRGRELRAVEARAQQPYGHLQSGPRNRADPLAGLDGLEVPLQLHDVTREVVGARLEVAAQRACGQPVRPRRTSEAELDAPGEKSGQRAELLGDHERRMIRQHDAAGADADRLRAGGDVADDDRRGRAGDAGHVVVLGQPEAPVVPAFGVLREVEGVAQRGGGVAAQADGGEIEDRKGDHDGGPVRRQ